MGGRNCFRVYSELSLNIFIIGEQILRICCMHYSDISCKPIYKCWCVFVPIYVSVLRGLSTAVRNRWGSTVPRVCRPKD